MFRLVEAGAESVKKKKGLIKNDLLMENGNQD